MLLTTRRFVFPAFRLPQRNKTQPLVGLNARFSLAVLLAIAAFGAFVSQRRRPPAPCPGSESTAPLPPADFQFFLAEKLSVECLVEETSDAYNATSGTSICARRAVTWQNTWRLLFLFRKETVFRHLKLAVFVFKSQHYYCFHDYTLLFQSSCTISRVRIDWSSERWDLSNAHKEIIFSLLIQYILWFNIETRAWNN